jgi:hypothetical protein
MSRKFVWLALVLPLLVIVLAMARAELFLHGAQEFKLPIEGYDPRDLLQGRYLQFRLALDREHGLEREACAPGTPCCWCLTRVPGQPAARAELASCTSARAQCGGALPLSAAEKPFRFYVPESQAPALERALGEARLTRRAFAVLAIDPSGEARVSELSLNGKSYTSHPGAGTP